MTMRFKGVTVTFDQDLRTDDAEAALNAIRCIRGVADVGPLESTHVDIMARIRGSSEVQTEQRCDACRFWKRVEQQGLTDYEQAPPYVSGTLPKSDPAFVGVGKCRRNPPQIVELIISGTTEAIKRNHKICLDDKSPAVLLRASCYPYTWDCGWCGEFQPKAKP